MNSRATLVIPKESQTAFERWEMASFGGNDGQSSKLSPSAAAALAKACEEGRAQGHAIGLEEGRTEGINETRRAAADEIAKLRQITAALTEQAQQADDLILDDILKMSVDIAHAMLKTALQIKPELVLGIVRDSINYFPSVHHPAILILHGDDAALVKKHMEQELTSGGWRVQEDPQMERGGCRIETASNHIEANLATRWQRITAALNQDSSWLES